MVSWRWAAASRRGTGHAALGSRRQDVQRVLTAGSDFIVAIACDGAGSTTHGGLGAAMVARSISTRAAAWLNAADALPCPDEAAAWVQAARVTLEELAARHDLAVADLATTLVAAISNGENTLTLHVGDGAIACLRGADAMPEAISWPHHGEFASTTYFVTAPFLRLRISMMRNMPVNALAVTTDGLERLALDYRAGVPHAGFFGRMFAAVDTIDEPGRDQSLCQHLARFLDSAPVNARTDDDKTLILAALR